MFQPAPTISLLTCSKCHATNQAYATFCHSCGCMIGAPPRNDPRNNGITVGGRSTSQVRIYQFGLKLYTLLFLC